MFHTPVFVFGVESTPAYKYFRLKIKISSIALEIYGKLGGQDCFWSIMVIAQELDIDLEKEFLINLEYLQQKLSEEVGEL